MDGLCSKCRTKPRRVGGQRYCLDCHNQYCREHPRTRKPRAYDFKHNVRVKAHQARAYGHLVAVPCDCGCGTALARLQMHHEDYDRPFDVVFCCPKEHHRLDAARVARLRSAHGEEAQGTEATSGAAC